MESTILGIISTFRFYESITTLLRKSCLHLKLDTYLQKLRSLIGRKILVVVSFSFAMFLLVYCIFNQTSSLTCLLCTLFANKLDKRAAVFWDITTGDCLPHLNSPASSWTGDPRPRCCSPGKLYHFEYYSDYAGFLLHENQDQFILNNVLHLSKCSLFMFTQEERGFIILHSQQVRCLQLVAVIQSWWL